jgi:uncharacterized protein DUF2330
MARRLLWSLGLSMALIVLAPGAAFACGGLVAPGHAEVLRRAVTLAAWHDGFEHYVTGFQFGGSASTFGYIIPLPAEPTKIQKAGDWTLERLELEVNPVRFAALDAAGAPVPAASPVTVLQQVKIDALDITVVKGGGADVAVWAEHNGFDLTPDTPDVLGRYSSEGAIFALAKFDNDAAASEGFVEGQGQVIHFTIPTPAPWVPLRILALGKVAAEQVDADVFLLDDHPPAVNPTVSITSGWTVRQDGPASESLLADLRSDRGMAWLPASGMWFTALTLSAPAGTIAYDLSVDGGGPRAVFGGIVNAVPFTAWPLWIALAGLAALVGIGARQRRGSAPA